MSSRPGNINLLDYHFIHHEEANYFPVNNNFFDFFTSNFSSEHNDWTPAQEGTDNFIRHALAPGRAIQKVSKLMIAKHKGT